jgi:hypothetical protein
MKISKSNLQEFIREIKRLNIRHKPFRSNAGYYEIELYPNPNELFLQLKYGWQASKTSA